MENNKFLNNGQPLENSNLQAKKERVYYFDYLKLFLITLVISHHSLEAYLVNSQWKYKDVVHSEWLQNIHVINSTFFMGIFFFISGYFVINSIRKRSTKDFILSKVRHLFLPLVLIGTVIVPLEYYISGRAMDEIHSSFLDYYINVYWGTGIMSYEHGWYVLSLLLYSVIYMLIINLTGEKIIKSVGKISYKKLLVISIIMVVCTYIMHMYYSYDQWITVVGIIGLEPVHYPQYIILFILGSMAYENNWLDQITDRIGWTSVCLGLASIAFICFKDILDSSILNEIYSVYYIYESFVCMTICIGLIFIFKRYLNVKNRFFDKASKCTFGVYIWHILFVFIFQILIAQYELSAIVKYLIVTIASVVTTFSFVYLKDKLIYRR